MKSSYLSFQTLLIIAFLSFIFYSCKKEKHVAKSSMVVCSTTYHFTYTGIRLPNDTITFSSTEPVGCTFLWNFGDGHTDTTSSPIHQYSDTGTYIVTLTINNDTSHMIDTAITIFKDPLYTHLIAGARLWHHSFYDYEYLSGGYRDTTINYPDTSFSVNYIDPLTIAIGTDTLLYVSSSDSVLTFQHGYNPNPSHDNVYFNYLSNSLFFQKYDHISAGSYSNEDYTTP